MVLKKIKNTYKNCFLGAFVLILCSAASAQDSTLVFKKDTVKVNPDLLKSTVTANIFTSIPTGVFKSTDLNNLNSGYAKIGYGAELGYGYKLCKSLYIRGSLSYMRNFVNSQKIADQILSMTNDQVLLSNKYSSASATYWENYTITGGFSYQLWCGAKKKIGVEPVVMLGSTYCYTPYVKYDMQIDLQTFETRNYRKGNWAFTHKEGVKFNYLLGSKTVASFDVSYFSAMANAKGMEHIVLGNGNYSRTFEDYKINVSSVLVGIGISTRF